jgi:DNA-binding NtrC family response regulator
MGGAAPVSIDRRQVWIALERGAVQVVVERVLRTAGFQTEGLGGPGPLLARLEAGSPDLVVLDRQLLDAAGSLLASRLGGRPRRPGLIAIAERGDAEGLLELPSLEIEILERPVEAARLLRAAGRLLVTLPPGPAEPADMPDVVVCGFGEHGDALADELIEEGFRTYLAPSGLAAGPRVLAGHYRLLLLDLQATGAERMLHAVARLPGQRPVVAVGRVDWQRAETLRRLDQVDFLEKPVRLGRVPALVGERLGSPAAVGAGRGL